MDWISHFLKDFPPAATFRSKLEQLEKENNFLKRQNTILKLQLDALNTLPPPPANNTPRTFDSLDTDINSPHAEDILQFIFRTEDVKPSEIAGALSMRIELVERYLDKLARQDFVQATYAIGEEPEYFLQRKGREHLGFRGLI
jgi:hypothetical protein